MADRFSVNPKGIFLPQALVSMGMYRGGLDGQIIGKNIALGNYQYNVSLTKS